MNLIVITPPEEEPVSVATVKSHARIDHSQDDALLAVYLQAAREMGEGLARRAFVTQTLRYVVNTWPVDRVLKLPRPPLQSVESVTYLDADEVEHSWSEYQVDERSEPGRLIFDRTPTATLLKTGAVAVEFVAGYGTAEDVPAVFKQGIMQTVAHWYENREIREIPRGAKDLFLSDRGSYF